MENLHLESHFDILLSAEDKELSRLCRLNRHYRSICEDQRFWKDRTRLRYGSSSLFKGSSTWRRFYQDLSQRALYMVLIANEIYLVNDINIAYEAIIDALRDIIDFNSEDIDVDFMNIDQSF